MCRTRKHLSIVIFLAMACVVGAHGQSTATLPKAIKWERLFGDPEYELEYKAATYSKLTDEIWIVVGKRTGRKLGGEQQLSLWVLSAAGEKVADLPFSTLFSSLELTGQGIVRVDGIESLASGEVIVCADSSRGGVLLLVLDARARRLVKTSRVKLVAKNWVVNTILPGLDGNLFFFGRESEKPAVAKGDRNGNVVWERSIESKNLSVALEGVEAESSGLTVLGVHVDTAGARHSWLGNLTSTGAPQEETTLPGEHGSLGIGVKAGVVVVHDAPKTQTSPIVVDRFDSNLQKLWTREILPHSESTTSFRLARRKGGGFLVVGPAGGEGLWMGTLSEDGNVSSVYNYRDPSAMSELTWNCGIVPFQETLIVVTTILRAGSSGEQRQMLRIFNVVSN